MNFKKNLILVYLISYISVISTNSISNLRYLNSALTNLNQTFLKFKSFNDLLGPILETRTLNAFFSDTFIVDNGLNGNDAAIISQIDSLNAYQLRVSQQGPFDCTYQTIKNGLFVILMCDNLKEFDKYYENLFDKKLYKNLLNRWSELIKIDLTKLCASNTERKIIDFIKNGQSQSYKSETLLPSQAPTTASKIIAAITLFEDDMYDLQPAELDTNYTNKIKAEKSKALTSAQIKQQVKLAKFLHMAKQEDEANFENFIKQIKTLKTHTNYAFAVNLGVPGYSFGAFTDEKQILHNVAVIVHKVNTDIELLFCDSLNLDITLKLHKQYRVSLENLRDLVTNQDIDFLAKLVNKEI